MIPESTPPNVQTSDSGTHDSGGDNESHSHADSSPRHHESHESSSPGSIHAKSPGSGSGSGGGKSSDEIDAVGGYPPLHGGSSRRKARPVKLLDQALRKLQQKKEPLTTTFGNSTEGTNSEEGNGFLFHFIQFSESFISPTKFVFLLILGQNFKLISTKNFWTLDSFLDWIRIFNRII